MHPTLASLFIRMQRKDAEMKTLIAIPCMDSVPTEFAISFAALDKPEECEYAVLKGSLIYESRNLLCKKAITTQSDYIMWFDSDMQLPKDVIPKMIKHMEEGYEIVTGLYFRRAAPFTPVLFKSYEEQEDSIKWEDYNDYPKDSFFEIAGCGFGCVMIKTEILLDLLLNYNNWFMPLKNCGEDMSFCFRAKELGHKIYCDSTIKCGHVAHMVVDESVYQALGGINESQSKD